jgi:Tol biopolymer transport system component
MKNSLFVSILILWGLTGHAQDITQNQPDINWKIIKTENFKIIFPDYIEKDAQVVANTLEFVREPISKTLHTNLSRWPIVLSTNGAQANGYVTTGPKRSEWYSAPPQGTFLGTGEWYNLLAVHEGRHMVQFDKLDHGLTRLAHILFGQTIANALSSWSVPMWFWEGDAVGTETALTFSGRGRIPSFDMHVRTLLLNDQKQSYYKASCRSLKDYYPNHYILGYHMVTHVKRNFPVDTWSQVLRRTSNFSISPFRLSRMLKKTTGYNARRTYNNSMKELDTIWRKQIEGLKISEAEMINTTKKKVQTNYNFSCDAGDFIISQKSGMADAYQFVKINKETREEKRIKQAAAYDGYSYAKGWLCWNEYHSDHRYLNQNYSNIVLYHIDSAKTIYFTKNARYFVPALDPEGEKIAVVEFTNTRDCHLLILDRKTKKEIYRLPNKDNYFIKRPQWSPDGKRLVYTKQKYSGKALAMYEPLENKEVVLIPEGTENINNPVFYQNYIIYESAYSGIDNIYAIDIQTKKRYQITSRKYGASMPAVSVDEKTLYFSDYNIKGYDLASMPLDPKKWIPLENVVVRRFNYAEPIIASEQGKSILDGMQNVPRKNYETKDYKTRGHFLNIHDWNIIPGFTDLQFSITSTDLLNTTKLNLGINYHRNEKAFNTFADFSFAKYYPVFSGGFSFGERYLDLDTDGNSGIDSTDTWKEKAMNLNVLVPYVCTRGNWTKQAYGRIGLSYTNITGQLIPETGGEINGSFIPLNYQIHFQNSYTSPLRNLHPKYHMSFDLNINHTPFKGDYTGKHLSFNSLLYLPGIGKHHSTIIELGTEYQKPGNYYFNSDVLFARGYQYQYHDKYRKISLGYEMPLIYPDLHLGFLFFLRRISTAIYYDYSRGITNSVAKDYTSASLEINFNFSIFNLPVYLEAGYRHSYRFLDNKITGSFLFLDIPM